MSGTASSRLGLAAIGLVAVASLGLSGCADVSSALGFAKNPPDEFTVVRQAPLSLPPDYNLRPPKPGADRPQQASAVEQARKSVFKIDDKARGVVVGQAATGFAATPIGERLGLASADPQIRKTLVEEAGQLADQEKTFLDRLLFWKDPEDDKAKLDESLLNAGEEQRRIQENKALGKPLDEGNIPIIERKSGGLFSNLF